MTGAKTSDERDGASRAARRLAGVVAKLQYVDGRDDIRDLLCAAVISRSVAGKAADQCVAQAQHCPAPAGLLAALYAARYQFKKRRDLEDGGRAGMALALDAVVRHAARSMPDDVAQSLLLPLTELAGALAELDAAIRHPALAPRPHPPHRISPPLKRSFEHACVLLSRSIKAREKCSAAKADGDAASEMLDSAKALGFLSLCYGVTGRTVEKWRLRYKRSVQLPSWNDVELLAEFIAAKGDAAALKAFEKKLVSQWSPERFPHLHRDSHA